MDLPNPNKLLVEGEEDRRVIPQLIELNGIPWGEHRNEWIVEIEAVGGIEEILKPGSFSAELKERNLKRLGILVDADDDPEHCWQRIRSACAGEFPRLPTVPDPAGTVVSNVEGKTLGIWLMPDNRSRGMLETFLAYLVPDGGSDLWTHACEAVAEAQSRGAPCRDAHNDKARIHTWLAWQDPPGRQLHNALIERILDPRSPYAEAFVAWFRRLYGL